MKRLEKSSRHVYSCLREFRGGYQFAPPPTGFLSVTVMVSAEFVELRLERWQRAVVVRRVAWPSGVRDDQRMS